MQNGYILELDDWVKSVDDHEYKQYLGHGFLLKETGPDITIETIRRFKNSNGNLSAADIMDDLFTEIDADVFLSHSHEDLEAVTAFAGYLDSIGRTPFVDSFIWGDVYKLLKQINKMNSGGSIKYNEFMYTAAQVYMMLNGSLISMIDRTADFVLLESPESIQNDTTFSPWIFSEILYSRILSTISHSEQAIFEHVAIEYPAYTKHLIPLSPSDVGNVLGKRKRIYG